MSMQDLVTVLNPMLKNLTLVFEPFLINSLNSTLDPSILNDNEKTSVLFCNGNGNFLKDTFKCDCDVGFFLDRCSVAGTFYWGGSWTAIIVIFSMFYVISTIISWTFLKTKLENEMGSFWKKIRRLIYTPKFLVLLNLVIITTCKLFLTQARMVYILVDPYKLRGIFNRIADRIIHELVFSTSFSLFLILLIVWMGLYTGIKKQRNSLTYERMNKCYLITKDVVIFFLFFIYPFQIAFSYYRGSRNLDPSTFNIVIYVMCGVTVIFILLFIYYTLRIKYLISKSYYPGIKSESRVVKVKEKPFHPDQENSLHKFMDSLKENTTINYVYNLIINPNTYNRNQNENSDEDEEKDYYYEEEMADIDIKKFKDNEDSLPINKESNGINISNNLSRSKQDANGALIAQNTGNLLNENEIQIKKSNEKRKTQEMKINRNSNVKEEIIKPIRDMHLGKRVGNKFETKHKDISILNKIFGVSYLIIITGALILAFGLLFKGTNALKSVTGAIVIFFFSFLFESVIIIAMFYLFIRDVQSKEYETLKVIGEFENYLNDKEYQNRRIQFIDLRDSHLKSRIKQFVHFEE